MWGWWNWVECHEKVSKIQCRLSYYWPRWRYNKRAYWHGDTCLKGGCYQGLIAALSKDADNVFTVLTARELNKDLYIVSRAIDKKAHEKLKIAGANNTISPDEIGGSRMAALMLNPTVISFLDIITHAGEVVLDLEDVVICDTSSIANMTLREIKIPEKTGLIVLAIKKRQSQKLEFNPNSDETLQVGDTMIVLGRQEQVIELRKLACDQGERNL